MTCVTGALRACCSSWLAAAPTNYGRVKQVTDTAFLHELIIRVN
jgi:hypothetical protein